MSHPSKIFWACLFHISFTPLWISIIFIDVKSYIDNHSNLYTEYISLVCICISCLISLLVLRSGLYTDTKEGTSTYKIISVKEEKTITAEYLLSYILPLSAFDFTHWSSIVLFLIFYLTFGYLCVRHNYFCTNIILELAGFRFYLCSVDGGQNQNKGCPRERIVISRCNLIFCATKSLELKKINNEYMLDVR